MKDCISYGIIIIAFRWLFLAIQINLWSYLKIAGDLKQSLQIEEKITFNLHFQVKIKEYLKW